MRWPIALLALAAVAAPALPAASAPIEPADKIICKRQVETGTLAKVKKTCLTVREWQRLRDGSQELGQNLRDRNFSSCAQTAPQEGPRC